MDENKVKFVIKADRGYQNMRQSDKKRKKKIKIQEMEEERVWSKKFCTSWDVKLQWKKNNYIPHFEVSIPK